MMPPLGARLVAQPESLGAHALDQFAAHPLERSNVQAEVLGEVRPVDPGDRVGVELVANAQRELCAELRVDRRRDDVVEGSQPHSVAYVQQ